jgi:hypothetical protein
MASVSAEDAQVATLPPPQRAFGKVDLGKVDEAPVPVGVKPLFGPVHLATLPNSPFTRARPCGRARPNAGTQARGCEQARGADEQVSLPGFGPDAVDAFRFTWWNTAKGAPIWIEHRGSWRAGVVIGCGRKRVAVGIKTAKCNRLVVVKPYSELRRRKTRAQ